MAPERVLELQNLSEGTKMHIFRSKIAPNPPKNAIFETSDGGSGGNQRVSLHAGFQPDVSKIDHLEGNLRTWVSKKLFFFVF